PQEWHLALEGPTTQAPDAARREKHSTKVRQLCPARQIASHRARWNDFRLHFCLEKNAGDLMKPFTVLFLALSVLPAHEGPAYIHLSVLPAHEGPAYIHRPALYAHERPAYGRRPGLYAPAFSAAAQQGPPAPG